MVGFAVGEGRGSLPHSSSLQEINTSLNNKGSALFTEIKPKKWGGLQLSIEFCQATDNCPHPPKGLSSKETITLIVGVCLLTQLILDVGSIENLSSSWWTKTMIVQLLWLLWLVWCKCFITHGHKFACCSTMFLHKLYTYNLIWQ